MSEWITDRAPVKEDCNGFRKVWIIFSGRVCMIEREFVEVGDPWMPISKPEPYVAPEPNYYAKLWLAEQSGEQNRWCVYCNVGGIQADNLPNREAAERIAAIYNEVMS